MMTTGNAGAGGGTALLQTEAAPVVPHILIAEDQPTIQDLLCWALQLAGYRATVCPGRQAALTWREQATPPGDCPVVLLLDVSLLCANEATDFLCCLRARWQNTGYVPPLIIVLTTSTQVQAELGMRERVLQKPFHIRELLTLIQQVIPDIA